MIQIQNEKLFTILIIYFSLLLIFFIFRKDIINTISIVLKDSLSNPDSKYSGKKLSAFISLGIGIFAFLYELIIMKYFYEAGFWAFMGMAGYQHTLSMVSNKIPDSPDPTSDKNINQKTVETKTIEVNKTVE